MPRTVTALSAGVLVGAVSIVVPVAIWPGEAKLTAPLFCSSPATEPMVVYTGPKKTGAALIAAVATDAEKQATPRRGKKSRVAAKKPDTAAPKAEGKTEAKSDTKPAAKPVVVVVRHASAKPDTAAKPAEKKPAAKPATPKAAAKPKNDTKPAG